VRRRSRSKESLEKQGGAGTIENNLRTRKSIEALIATAKITDGEWVDEAALAAADAEAGTESGSEEEKPKKAAKATAKSADAKEPKEPKTAKKKSAKNES
jgi:hypothetical protein